MARVAAALIKNEQKFLIARRDWNSRFGGRWEFPGGKVRLAETPEACLRREIKEELNLGVRVGEHFCTVEYYYPDFYIELLVFWCTIEEGELQLKEHEEVRWVTVAEMADYDFVEADLQVIAALSSGDRG